MEIEANNVVDASVEVTIEGGVFGEGDELDRRDLDRRYIQNCDLRIWNDRSIKALNPPQKMQYGPLPPQISNAARSLWHATSPPAQMHPTKCHQ